MHVLAWEQTEANVFVLTILYHNLPGCEPGQCRHRQGTAALESLGRSDCLLMCRLQRHG